MQAGATGSALSCARGPPFLEIHKATQQRLHLYRWKDIFQRGTLPPFSQTLQKQTVSRSSFVSIHGHLPNKTIDKITWDVNQRAKLQTGTNYTVPHAKVVADETLRHADWSVRKYMELRRCSTVPGKVLKLRAYFWNHSKSKQAQTEVLSHKN